MGLTISSLFSRLFGKKQMRILMGERPRRRFRTPRSLSSWAQIRAACGDPTPGITGGPARRSGDWAAPHHARVPHVAGVACCLAGLRTPRLGGRGATEAGGRGSGRRVFRGGLSRQKRKEKGREKRGGVEARGGESRDLKDLIRIFPRNPPWKKV